jgi:hypothetical protein
MGATKNGTDGWCVLLVITHCFGESPNPAQISDRLWMTVVAAIIRTAPMRQRRPWADAGLGYRPSAQEKKLMSDQVHLLHHQKWFQKLLGENPSKHSRKNAPR